MREPPPPCRAYSKLSSHTFEQSVCVTLNLTSTEKQSVCVTLDSTSTILLAGREPDHLAGRGHCHPVYPKPTRGPLWGFVRESPRSGPLFGDLTRAKSAKELTEHLETRVLSALWLTQVLKERGPNLGASLIRVSTGRSWSHCVVLGAILWVSMAKI